MVGSAITSGDMDNDTFIDIVVSSNYADGPGNARKNCGEVYIIFAAGIRTRGFGLIGGYDPLTRTEGSGRVCLLKPHRLRVLRHALRLQGHHGPEHCGRDPGPGGGQPDLQMDPGLRNVLGGGATPRAAAALSPGLSSASSDGMNITIRYKVRFGWNYPNEEMHGAKILITNTSGVKVQSRYYNIYMVESDLDMTGTSRSLHR